MEERRRGGPKKKVSWGALFPRTRHHDVVVVVVRPGRRGVAHRAGHLHLLHLPVVVVDDEIVVVAVQQLHDFDVAARHRGW